MVCGGVRAALMFDVDVWIMELINESITDYL
jgi:hypothetical protein